MVVVGNVLWQQQKADIPSSPMDLLTHGSRIGVDILTVGFPGGSVVKNPPASAGDAGDTGLIPKLGRYPGEENGYQLWCSCLDNPKNRPSGHKQPDMT